MSSYRVKRIMVLPVAALLCVTLALPLASQAATGSGRTAPGPPLVSTGSVARVSGTVATLDGTLDPRTYATTYYFQYGPTIAYGQQTASATLPAGSTATVKISATASGFLSGYHYRLVASNEKGAKDGKDRTYTPTVTRKKSEFVLPKTFQPTTLGGTFVLSGTLTGADSANHEIALQGTPYPYTAPYTNLGTPLLSTATGAFSFRVQDMLTSTRFRVVTVGSLPLQSKIVPELVTARVTLKARSSGHKGLVRLYGTVTPAAVGAHVFLELEKVAKPKTVKPGKPEKPEKPGKVEKEASEKPPSFSSKFETTVKRATRTISRFSIVVSVRDEGHYRAFVQLAPGPVASGSSSTTVLLHAAAKTKTKKKKAG